MLVREDAPEAVWLAACKWAGDPSRRHSVDKSWDHAFWGPELESVEVILWMDNPNAFDPTVVGNWAAQFYPAIHWKLDQHFPSEEPDPEPPDPEPYPDWTPCRYIFSGTVGGFCGSEGDLGQLNVAEDLAAAGVPMPTAKLVVDVGAAPRLKALHPGIRIVGRKIDLPGTGSLEGFRSDLDPIWQADVRMQYLLPVMLANPAVDFWEVVNEQDPDSDEGHAALARFFIRAMSIAEANGKFLACDSYSVGVPEPPEWDVIAATGVFEVMAAGGHALALHEYGNVGEGHVVGRFRDVYDRIILPSKLDIPLFITEYGVRREDIARGLDFVWAQFVEYERMCAALPYFAGIHAYIGPHEDEDYYNAYVGIQPRFTEYAKGVKGRING